MSYVVKISAVDAEQLALATKKVRLMVPGEVHFDEPGDGTFELAFEDNMGKGLRNLFVLRPTVFVLRKYYRQQGCKVIIDTYFRQDESTLERCEQSHEARVGRCARWLRDDTICDMPDGHWPKTLHRGHDPYGATCRYYTEHDGKAVEQSKEST